MGIGAFGEPPASTDAIAELRRAAPTLPEEYFRFLAVSNGGEAPLPFEPWNCILWPAEEVMELNEEVPPGYVAIGSSGGGSVFAFKTEGADAGSIWYFPSIGWSSDDIWPAATDFGALIDAAGNEAEE